MAWSSEELDVAVTQATRSTPVTVDRTLSSRWPAFREKLAKLLLSDPDVGFYFFRMSANRLNAECTRIVDNLCRQIELTEELVPLPRVDVSTDRPRYASLDFAITESASGALTQTTLRQVQREATAALRHDALYLKQGARIARTPTEVYKQLEKLEAELAVAWELLQALIESAVNYGIRNELLVSLVLHQPIAGLRSAEGIQNPGDRFLQTAASVAAIERFTGDVPTLAANKQAQVTQVITGLAGLTIPDVASLARKPNFDTNVAAISARVKFLAQLVLQLGTLTSAASAALARLGTEAAAPDTSIPDIIASLTLEVTRDTRNSAIGMLNSLRANGFSIAEQWCSQFKVADVLQTDDGRKLVPQEAIAMATNQFAFALAADTNRLR